MFHIAVLLLVLSVLGCSIGAAVPDGRIVGGAPTTIEQYPYQISLQLFESHICGGSILSQNTVLTASHCVDSLSASKLKVRYGSSYHNSGGQIVPVDSIITHPSYDSSTQDYDVAILLLSEAIVLGNSASPIPLAYDIDDGDDSKEFVTGWGALKEGGSSPPVLHAVAVKIINTVSCRSSPYQIPASKITDRMICAASPGKDACQGDSGGPLVSNGALVGVVSWGYGCADPLYPGVYANVLVLRDWITKTANL